MISKKKGEDHLWSRMAKRQYKGSLFVAVRRALNPEGINFLGGGGFIAGRSGGAWQIASTGKGHPSLTMKGKDTGRSWTVFHQMGDARIVKVLNTEDGSDPLPPKG